MNAAPHPAPQTEPIKKPATNGVSKTLSKPFIPPAQKSNSTGTGAGTKLVSVKNGTEEAKSKEAPSLNAKRYNYLRVL